MSMPFYASAEQVMRDRSEFARKGIARGRSVVVLTYANGVLFVAENASSALHKVSEIYDRIGFAAVGKYNEFENLRTAGVRMADLRGYSYARRDVTGRAIATAFAQTLGSIFMDQTKPFEVEICIAEVGATPSTDELYRITYDGQAQDESGFLTMGGQAESVANVVRKDHKIDMSLTDAVRLAVKALASIGGDNGAPRSLEANQLEVAVLDRARTGRKFRRITGNALTPLLDAAKAGGGSGAGSAPAKPEKDDKGGEEGSSTPATGRAAVTPKPSAPAPTKPEPEPDEPISPEPEPIRPAEPERPAEPGRPEPAEPGPEPGGRPDTGHPDADPSSTPEVPPAPGTEA
jgi:proteasome alpha subunit